MKRIFTLLLGVCMLFTVQTYAQNAFWGGPGDANGEFDGGLNDWTTSGQSTGMSGLEDNPAAVWSWKDNATPDQGAYASGVTQIVSASAANGAAVVDSDWMDNNGVQGAFGMGVAPSPQLIYLTSPSIDCSGKNSVFLKFNQQYRNFNGGTYVEVSNDGGTVWEAFNFNANIPSNQNTITFWEDIQVIDISSAAANQADVQVRFTWDGDYYYWIIDDVGLYEELNGEVKLSQYYYSPKNFSTPIDQIDGDSLHFLAEVINLGGSEAEEVEVTVDVTDAGGSTIFTETEMVTIGAFDTAFVQFPTILEYTSANFALGDYRVDYSATSPTDLFPENNSRGRGFTVTEDLFSKGASKTWYYNWGSTCGVGNIYRTGDFDPELGDFLVTNVQYSGASNDGTITENYRIRLYKLSDDVNKNLDEFDVDAAPQFEISDPPHPQMTIVGFNNEAVAGLQNFSDMTSIVIDLEDPDLEGAKLDPNSTYMMLVYWESGTFFGVDERYPMSFFGEHIEAGPFQVSSLIFSDTWFISNEITLRAFHLNTQYIFEAAPSAVNELAEGSLNVYPNPVSDQVNIEIDLNKPSNAIVLLNDINGKVIQTENLNNVQNETISLNTVNLANGTYIVKLVTKDGSSSHKIVVAH